MAKSDKASAGSAKPVVEGVAASEGAVKPAAASTGPICIACGEPALRIIHGRDYCRQHREGSETPEVPIMPCGIEGCGSPAVAKIGGRPVCRYHDRIAA